MRKIAAMCVLALLAALAVATEPPSLLPSMQRLSEQLSHPSLYSSAVDAAPTDRRQTMRRVIASLPEHELHSLGLEVRPDGSIDISDERLEQLWEERQRQLREVFENVVKPKEHFEMVVGQLQTQQGDELVQTLKDLEGVLTDMDMATDFHTLGHWPVLTGFLSEQHPPPVRAAAAWAVGTAVKNSYDRQLWLLEEDSVLGNLLQVLGNACAGQEHLEAAKKAMYAIGAGSRGNTDVQLALRQRQLPQLLERLFDACADVANGDQAPLAAKMWHYVSDMVDERWYVQHTLLAEGNELSEENKQQLQQLVLLGDDFVESRWFHRAMRALCQLTGRDDEGRENLSGARSEALHSLLHVVRSMVQLQPSLNENLDAILAHLVVELDDELVIAEQVCSLVKVV